MSDASDFGLFGDFLRKGKGFYQNKSRFYPETRGKKVNFLHPNWQSLMSSYVEITLNLESESNFELFKTVRSALVKKPKILYIELVGVRQISQDIVLAIWDMVQDAKKGGLKVITKAYSSLYDGSVLLLLLGDIRRIRRHTAFIQLDSLKRLENTDFSEISRKTCVIEEPAWIFNYRNVVKIMNQFLPVEELSDKRLPMEVLGEYGLLGSDEDEVELQKLFAA